MLVFTWIATTAFVATTASATIWDAMIPSAVLKREELSLLKRQNLSVGSPLYNCHDNCGEAILEISSCGSVCNDTTFITDYNNCLQCSGPDNEDIWQYYGGELNDTAAACGFSTSPLSGTQDSVDAAITASNTSAACAAATESSGSSSTATATGSSASSTDSSSSAAAPNSMASFAGYGALAAAALCAFGI
ncbi:hypothetical protein N0V82_010203 [Gnomoniopsis sp. IMI 355080]|nr:hypothetical protein N0V82_010203 [Gnomoniopsis sp. IMI 355080]